MNQGEEIFLQDFSKHYEELVPIITNLLSEASKLESVLINLSPLQNMAIICSAKENNVEYINVKELLEKFIARWEQEQNYSREVMKLKDLVTDEFNAICQNLDNNKLIDHITDQSQKVIEKIFLLTDYDNKQMAGEFCKGLMNGFEKEKMSEINKYAIYVLWMPFPTPLVLGLESFIRDTFKKRLTKLDESSITRATEEIISYIQNYFGEITIETGEINSMNNEFEKCIKIALAERRKCLLVVNGLENIYETLLNLRPKIDRIIVRMSEKKFKKSCFGFSYEALELSDCDDSTKINELFYNLPKTLQSLFLDFSLKELSDEYIEELLTTLASKIASLKVAKVDLRGNNIKSYQVVNFQQILIKSKLNINLEIHQLKYEPYVNGGDDQMTILSNLLQHIKNLNELHVDFRYGHASSKGLTKLAGAIKHLSSITKFYLFFGYGSNKAEDDSFINLITVLGGLANLSSLTLIFSEGSNSITSKSIAKLAEIIGMIKSPLYFHFEAVDGKNKFTDADAKLLQKSTQYSSFKFQYKSNQQQ